MLEYAACYGAVAWDSLIKVRSGFLITTGLILVFGLGGFEVWLGVVSLFTREFGMAFVVLLLFSVLANLVFLGHTFTHAQRIRNRTTFVGVALGVLAAIALPSMFIVLILRLLA